MAIIPKPSGRKCRLCKGKMSVIVVTDSKLLVFYCQGCDLIPS